MIFVLSKIAGLVLRPSSLLLLCVLAGLPLRRRRLAWVGAGGFVLAMLLPLDQWALLPLEDRFPPPPPPAHVDGIVVLGGAVEPGLSVVRGIPSLNGAAERMTATVALARRYPAARVVFTGGSGAVIPGGGTEAAVARALFLDLGLPADRLVMEDASRTTWENAALTRDLVKPRPGETWLLVTSADHLPRAVGAFRAAGWDVTGWPVGYKSGVSWRLWLPGDLPSRLGRLDEAAHEWTGLVTYWAMGHSSALFPAP